jgi:heat shock protein HslJ
LAHTEWRLIEVGGASALGNATAEFVNDSDLTGNTGCNIFSAQYSVQGSELRLELEGLIWTERGCPSQELFHQERQFQDSLVAVGWYEISGEYLSLLSDTEPPLVFRAISTGDRLAESPRGGR